MLTPNPNIILIVDDQPTNLKILFSFLQGSGYKVLVAKTGESAIEKLQHVSPDLILLDVMMPGIDGFETCRQLKDSAETKNIPVIFMTALSEPMDKIKGLKFGAVDYITKPFQQEEVLARIENQLTIRRLQTQLEEQNRQLQQSQSLLASVLNSSLDGVAAFASIRNNQGQIIDFKWLLQNPAAEKIVGRVANELVGKQLLVEMPGNRETDLFEKYTRVVETGEPLETEVYYAHENVQAWLQVVAVKLDDGFAVTFRDITERKQMEQRNRALLDAIPDVMLRQRVDGTYLDIWEKQGYSIVPADVVGRNIRDLPVLPKAVQQGLFEHLQAAIETGELKTYEYELPMPDGVLTYESRCVKSGADEVIRIIRDVSDRKQAELALKESEARFRGIFENAAIAIGMTKADGTLIAANPTYETFLGYTEAELRCLNIAEITHPDDLGADIALTQEVIDGVRDSFQLEKRYIRKDGQIFWGRLTVSAIRNPEGEFQFTVAITEDINDRKLREFALRDSERRFRATFNDSFQFTGLLTPKGTVIEVNQTAFDFGGVKPTDVAGVPFWETGWWRERTLRVEEQGAHPCAREVGGEDSTINSIENAPSAPSASPAPSPKQEQLREAIKRAASGEFVRYEVDVRGVGDSLITLDFSIKPVLDETSKVVLLISEGRDITEYKRTQEALISAQKRLEYLLYSSPSIIYTCQTIEPYGATFVSENITVAFGYESREFIEDENFWANHIHPEDAKRIFGEIPQLFEKGHHDYEYRFLHKDGTYRWVYDALKLLRDEQGNPLDIVGSWLDITQRKHIEAAWRETQRWLQAIAEANPNILYVYDLIEQQNVYSNRQMLTILGYRAEEVQQMGTTVLPTLMHPDDFAAASEHFKKFETAQEGEIFEFEYRMRHKNGEWRWLISRETLFTRTADGMPKQILGAAADISDRKQAELEITAAKAALERQIQRVLLLERITQEIRSSLNSEQVFQTAAIQIGEAFSIDRCLIHTYIDHPIRRIPVVAEYKQPGLESVVNLEIPIIDNPHVQLMLAQDSVIASDDIYADPLLEAALPLCQQLGLKSMLAVRTSYQGKPNGAIGLHQYDRFRQWTDWEIELLESVAAQLGIAIAQANLLEQEKQQRTELATQNQALEKAKLDAEAANRAKSQFLSKMSHELRTPLNAILGFGQVMARNDFLTIEQREHLEIINRSGEHLLDLINDILSMAKIEAGQVTVNENRFDLYRLLDSLEEMLRLKATSKGLQLIVERGSDLPQYIQTDESKLRQVLINLLGNAIKFTQTGSVMLGVRTTTSQLLIANGTENSINTKQLAISNEQLAITFEVKDTGPGIAPDEIDTLFEPFVQTHTGRQSMEGTGLGLPISQQFVRLLGGEIVVSSALNQGAMFTFNIQVSLVRSADDKPISSKRRVVGLEPNQPAYRILIVEDAAVNRKLLVKILEPLGFEVRTATNGQEAIAVWENWSPHLIWMDMIMPVMDGYQATQQIKQTPKGRETIIIALTADAFEEQREAILRAGCDDFLPKPFKREVLLEKMAHYLGVHYLYDDQQAPTSPQAPAPILSVTPEALSVMPASWVNQLHRAALFADDELITRLIEQIPLEYDSLRQALRELLNNFRLEQLIDLTEPAGS
ncbi:MAG TPA: PAS domain S-box protein [Coleofasciculaceae cyanobacterium]|jgi:two-component system sensor histidine kinase/response regulator